ncbi:hypothetical protein LL3_01946 [Bacillus amyloliquefaciens LL3]|nr:hypothetical protein LL3_01946 [Bacillus amyloliquefaciens LL3]
MEGIQPKEFRFPGHFHLKSGHPITIHKSILLSSSHPRRIKSILFTENNTNRMT